MTRISPPCAYSLALVLASLLCNVGCNYCASTYDSCGPVYEGRRPTTCNPRFRSGSILSGPSAGPIFYEEATPTPAPVIGGSEMIEGEVIIIDDRPTNEGPRLFDSGPSTRPPQSPQPILPTEAPPQRPSPSDLPAPTPPIQQPPVATPPTTPRDVVPPEGVPPFEPDMSRPPMPTDPHRPAAPFDYDREIGTTPEKYPMPQLDDEANGGSGYKPAEPDSTNPVYRSQFDRTDPLGTTNPLLDGTTPSYMTQPVQ